MLLCSNKYAIILIILVCYYISFYFVTHLQTCNPPYKLVTPPYKLVTPPYKLVTPPYKLVTPPTNL